MASTFQIERGVPMPAVRSSGAKYPFADMEVGDSFTAPEIERTRISGACQNKARQGDKKFTIRKTGDGFIRVWRVK